MKDTILIVEDNKDVNNMLAETLHEAGYETESAYTGIEGVKAVREREYSLVLLDIMLPYKSGDQVLQEVRQFCEVPVIIISAKDMIGTKIDLLKLGADDYITKPFDLGEVTARVETLLRRTHRHEQKDQVYTYLDIELDAQAKRVSIQGKEIDLTAKEYLMMELFIINQEKVFTKSALYESIWEEEYLVDDSTIKTHMSNLRSKLKTANPETEYIETIRGLGYRMIRQNNL